MRVLLIMDPLLAVPPRHYGGIERVVADLANTLVRRGHEVTLWAAPGSQTNATLRPFGRQHEWTRWSNLRNELTLTARFAGVRRAFDVVHNFGRLAYLLPIARRAVAKVQTYMRPVRPRNVRVFSQLGARQMLFTAVSDAMRQTGVPGGGRWRVVYNCARPEQYALAATLPGNAPLLFLARLERCKGAHTAIDVARAAGHHLIVAGNVSTLAHEREYFERELRPRFDGTAVRYVGPVDDTQKIALLQQAAALLLPIEWDEPFPVTLPEALLCGTPVVAFRRGGVPEGIAHGVTGFVCDTAREMVASVQHLGAISRPRCREEATARFSDVAIATAYEQVYREALAAA